MSGSCAVYSGNEQESRIEQLGRYNSCNGSRATSGPFYYVRVIEIPKLRRKAYGAKFFGIHMRDEVSMTVQDRAYTSPIRYTP